MMMISMIKVRVGVLSIVAAMLVIQARGKVEPLMHIPRQLQHYLNICQRSGDLSQQPGQLVFWTVINQYAARFKKTRPNMTQEQISYFDNSLREAITPLRFSKGRSGSRNKRQAIGINNDVRVRREIRALSFAERRRYFRALNLMKRDTRLPPNTYDFISAFHSGENLERAHLGPSFLPWHRLYLWIFEYFLRQHDPRVTVPYWASVLDNDMEDATDTVIFSPAFYGSGVGEVVDGPFRTWTDLNPDVTITRNVQRGGLYTHEGIERIISQTRTRDIVMPTALPGANSEMQHGAAHVFIGGNQMELNDAAQDPIFFSHHAFVDYIWEHFKRNQRRNGIDPESDYHFDEFNGTYNSLHGPFATAGFERVEGASEWTMEAGNLNTFSEFVIYEDIPTCETRCGNSIFLRCGWGLQPVRCVGRSRSELQFTGLLNELNFGFGFRKRKKRQAVSTDNVSVRQLVCPKKNFLNDVEIRHLGFTSRDLSVNHNSWAYVPIRIVSKRPSEYTEFNRYSLDSMATPNNRLGLKNTFIAPSVQKTYAVCDKMQGAIGKIKVVGYGLSYKGYAEEYAVVDNRLGVAESIAYLPIKVPATEPTEVMVAAFDTCGRVCRPYCKKNVSEGEDSQFTGAIRVTSSQPLQYANSYGDATLNVWDIPQETVCPKINYGNIPVSFFCDYSTNWVWNYKLSPPQTDGPGSIISWDIRVPINSINWLPSGDRFVIPENHPSRRRGDNMGTSRGFVARVPQRGHWLYLMPYLSQQLHRMRG